MNEFNFNSEEGRAVKMERTAIKQPREVEIFRSTVVLPTDLCTYLQKFFTVLRIGLFFQGETNLLMGESREINSKVMSKCVILQGDFDPEYEALSYMAICPDFEEINLSTGEAFVYGWMMNEGGEVFPERGDLRELLYLPRKSADGEMREIK